MYKDSDRRVTGISISEIFGKVNVDFCFIFMMKVCRVIST